MDCRGGGVNPAQLRRDFELLGAERPGDDDFGVTKLLLDSVVTSQMDDFDLWEIFS